MSGLETEFEPEFELEELRTGEEGVVKELKKSDTEPLMGREA